MDVRDHDTQAENVGAYLLGALSDVEREAFERHLSSCDRCRDEVERLRPAAEVLPRSVPPVAPPPSLKASLMEIVEREARERSGGRAPARRFRLLPAWPARAWAAAAAVLAVGVAIGIGIGRLGTGDETRTLTARVDTARLPLASASLVLPDGGEDGGILRVRGLPDPGPGKAYQAWVQRGEDIRSAGTFRVGAGGDGAAAVTADLEDADAVMVTRERSGGARAPTERPVLRVQL
jgi:anti-sigma-K factor RskA